MDQTMPELLFQSDEKCKNFSPDQEICVNLDMYRRDGVSKSNTQLVPLFTDSRKIFLVDVENSASISMREDFEEKEYKINNSSSIKMSSNDEQIINISYDNLKLLNLFTYLCCFCFPVTGILSIVYSSLAKKYYKLHNWRKTRDYLKKTEYTLLFTLMLGIMSFSFIFLVFEYYIFNPTANFIDSNNQIRVFHMSRSLPKK
jgi:hypothetical protein